MMLLLVGRMGGTGILCHKSLSSLISVIDTGHPRLSAVIIEDSVCGPILLVSAYLPTDYGDSDSAEEYIATCTCISALYNDCDAVQLIVAGDFNCQVGSRFFNAFKDFVDDNNFKLTDINTGRCGHSKIARVARVVFVFVLYVVCRAY